MLLYLAGHGSEDRSRDRHRHPADDRRCVMQRRLQSRHMLAAVQSEMVEERDGRYHSQLVPCLEIVDSLKIKLRILQSCSRQPFLPHIRVIRITRLMVYESCIEKNSSKVQLFHRQ